MKRDTRKEMRWIVGLIVLAIASRLFPHPPNFAPITGIALFSAAKLHNKWTAFLIPLVGLFFTDLILGIGWINLFVYLSFGLISLWGQRQQKMHLPVLVGSSLLFFFLSNLGVWILYYPPTWEGLATTFTLAIPFYTNTLLGDLFYTTVLFFSYSFIEKRYLSAA